MDFGLTYLLIGIYPAIIIWTIVVLILNWVKSANNNYHENPKSVMLTIFGIIFTSLGPLLGFMRYDGFREIGIPFDPKHVFAIELLVFISGISYWLSRFCKYDFPPAVNYFLRAALLQGIILDLFVSIHFIPFYPYGIFFAPLGFELLAPPIAMTFLLYELRCNIGASKYNNSLHLPVQKKIAFQSLALGGLVLAQIIFLLPLGFEWNSLILSFTKSHGFIFSSDFELFPSGLGFN